MGKLTIPLVTEEDQGIYVCTGSNMHDTDQANARLRVICKSILFIFILANFTL